MLHAQNLSKRFDGREVLKDVGFRIEPGEVYGLLGGNGAGKSTAISIIAGLVAPDAGDVAIGDARSPRARREKIGLAPQEIALYPDLTCEEHLRFFGRLYRVPRARLRATVERTIELAGLAEYRAARVAALSGGWKRRLNLAVALVHSPPILLLDEPTAGLDVDARQVVWRLIDAVRSEGAAILLTTHLLDEAEALCNRLAILVHGRIAAEGTLSELRSRVPAAELAVVEAADEARLRGRARELGIATRDYAGRLTLLLAERSNVNYLLDWIGDVGLRSIALQPVSLLHVYLEVTGGTEAHLPEG